MAAWLLSVYRSQIDGGKAYDTAAFERWSANATFDKWDDIDRQSAMLPTVDLLPLVQELSLREFVESRTRHVVDRVLANVSASAGSEPPLKAKAQGDF